MAVPLWRKAKRKRKRPPVPRKPGLYIEGILRWADAWKARTGLWPRRDSGRIPESTGDKWSAIDAALHKGYRGLPEDSSLAQLLAERRGVRNRARLPRLEIPNILAWADAWKARTGAWPGRCFSRIPEFPGDSWIDIDNALKKGLRGLAGGSTLAQLLADRRGVRHHMHLHPFTFSTILAWADAWNARMGTWPRSDSGSIPQSPGDKWATIDDALTQGRRGLPGGSSLPQLLAQRRGVRNRKRLPHFKVSTILKWADALHRRTGEWPRTHSGAIADAPGETWVAVNSALHKGLRGLPGGSSLASLLAHERGLRLLRHLPRLSEELILSWADAHFQTTGAWPNQKSGTIDVQPSEKWYTVETALRQGLRGLPGGSSLYRLLVAHGRIKPPKPRGLKRRRIEAGLSRRELAKKLRIALATVVTWEDGRSVPMPATLAALARILGLPVDQLRAEMEAVRNDRRKMKMGKTLD